MNTDNNHMEELVIKYLAGEASVKEGNEVLAWSSKNPENGRHFLALKKVFDLTQQHYQQEMAMDIDIDQEWKHFRSQVGSAAPVIPLHPRHATSHQWLRLAAVFLLLVAATFVIRYFVSRTDEIRVQTAGNTREVSLPDGSRITLNGYSELAYSQKFGQANRTVTLKGEAFFEVVHDGKKPFRVQVHDATVEDIGTSFDVLGYENRKNLEVIVQTGIVRLSVPGLKKEITLTVGQKGVYAAESKVLTSSANEDINFLSWNTRRIVFTGTDLHQVIETLNRTYHSNIILATDVSPSCSVTVTFDHQTLDAVLHVLETTLNLTYRKTGDKIEIIRAGC